MSSQARSPTTAHCSKRSDCRWPLAASLPSLLGHRTIPARTDRELLRLMTIVCDCYSAKEASHLLNGLLQAHDKNPHAFDRLAN